MDVLIAFLKARLDEVEAEATAAKPDWNAEHVVFEWQDFPDEVFAHARRHSPASVLREVATWRRILLEFSIPPGTDAKYGGTERETGFRLGLSFALKAKALEWKDHPDFPLPR